MEDIIQKTFTIGRKNITVIYDLRFYSEREYKKDFKDFLDYPRKEKISSGLIFSKFYRVATNPIQ